VGKILVRYQKQDEEGAGATGGQEVTAWTDREDRIVASKLDYPDITLAELQTALAAIGSKRTIKGIESRVSVLRKAREAKVRTG
jgi:hypothetical protein